VNVSFGLVALLVGFCLAVVGIKNKAQGYSLGGTLAQLLRGTWPYGQGQDQVGPAPAFGPSTQQNLGGLQDVPFPAGPGINPGGPFQGLYTLPPAGSPEAGGVTV